MIADDEDTPVARCGDCGRAVEMTVAGSCIECKLFIGGDGSVVEIAGRSFRFTDIDVETVSLRIAVHRMRKRLVDGFFPEDKRALGMRLPLHAVVQHAVEHHDWHHQQEGKPRE